MSYEDFLFLALVAILFNGVEPLRDLGFPIDTVLAHFDPEIILLLQSKFQLKEEMSKIDLQDGSCDSHLGFSIGSFS